MLTTSIGLLITPLAAFAISAWLLPLRSSKPVGRHRILEAGEHHTPMDTTLWVPGYPHEAPEHPLGTNEAHLTMQRHRRCRREECARKAAAFTVLVEAGRINFPVR